MMWTWINEIAQWTLLLVVVLSTSVNTRCMDQLEDEQ